MAFMKNINDLRGILTLMVLTLPLIAANIDCNGKPFHCVNSTHFMICVDIGSGVSNTIDDFVIHCPPTTVCDGNNRFECEFPPVTTTTLAPSAVPIISVSDSVGTVSVTTPVYDVTTSIPFEDYFNTLSETTLSEDLITHQTSVTEPTIEQVTQNIGAIPGPEMNSTVSENIIVVNVVQDVLSTQPPLPDSVSIGLVTDTTEYGSGIIHGSESNFTFDETNLSVTAVQNHLTTITPLSNNGNMPDLIVDTEHLNVIIPGSESNLIEIANNIGDNATRLIPDATEYVIFNGSQPKVNATLSNMIQSITDANATDFIPGTTENVNAMVFEPEANTTLIDIMQKATDISANATDIIPNTTENLNVMGSEPEAGTTLINSIQSAIDISANDTDMIPNTTENVNAIVSEPEANTTLSDIMQRATETSANATDMIANTTENINAIVPEANTTLIDIMQRATDISANATDIILNTTENVNAIVSAPEANTTLSDIMQRATETSANATDMIANTTENINAIVPEANTTLIDIMQRATDISANATDIILNTTENINAIVSAPEANTTLSDIMQRATDISANVTDMIANTTENVYAIVSEPEANTTLSDIMQRATDISANATDMIANTTENVYAIVSEPEANTTLSDIMQRATDISANATDMIANTTEYVYAIVSEPEANTTLIDITQRVTDISANATDIIPNTTENLNVMVSEPEADTILINTTQSAIDISANDTDMIPNTTENVNVMGSEPEANTTLNDTMQRSTDTITKTTDVIPDTTENVKIIVTEPEANATLSYIMKGPTVINANATDLITDTTDHINVRLSESDANITLSDDNIQGITAKSANATYQIPDATENTNFISKSKANANLGDTIQIATDILHYDLTVIDTFSRTSMTSDLVDNSVTESIVTAVTEITPRAFINIAQNHLAKLSTPNNTALSEMIEDIVTEPTMNEVTNVINVIKSEPNTFVDNNILKTGIEFVQNNFTTVSTPNITAALNNVATEPTFTDLTNITNVIKPDSNSTLSKSFPSTAAVQNDLTNHKPPSDSSLPSDILTEITVTSVPAFGSIIENNPTTLDPLSTELSKAFNNLSTVESINIHLTDTDVVQYYINTTTFNTSSTASPDNTDVPTEPIISQPNVVTQLYSPSTTVMSNEKKTVIPVSSDTLNFVETTIDSFLETTVSTLAGAIDSITYSNANYYIDAEDIEKEILIKSINNNPMHREKVLSTSLIENTASTPTFIVMKNDHSYIIPSASITNEQVTNTPEISGTITLDTEPILSIRNNESNIQKDTFENKTDNNIQNLVQNSEGNGTSKSSASHIVQVSSNDLPVDATNLEVVLTSDRLNPEYSIETDLRPASASGNNIKAKPAVNNNNILFTTTNSPIDFSTLPNINSLHVILPKIIERDNEIVTTKQTTVTETNQVVNSETSSVHTPNVSITESAVSLDILPNPIDMDDLTLQGSPKEAAPITNITKMITNSSNSLSLNNSTRQLQPILENMQIKAERNITENGSKIINQSIKAIVKNTTNSIIEKQILYIDYNTSKSSSNTINKEVVYHTVNTVMHNESSVPGLYSTTEVIATEVSNDSNNVEPSVYVESVNNKNDDRNFSQTTMSSLLASNVPSEIQSVSDIIPDIITTKAPATGDQGLEISLLRTDQPEIPDTISPRLTSKNQTAFSVQNSTKIEAGTKTPELFIRPIKNTLVTKISTAEIRANSEIKPYSSMNDIDFTATTTNVNVLMENTLSTISVGIQETKENNPLINLLINSMAQPEQIEYEKFAAPEVLLESTSTQVKTPKPIANAAFGDFTRPVKDNVPFVGSTLPEYFTESAANIIEANTQTFPSSEILLKGNVHSVERAGQEINMDMPQAPIVNKNFSQVPSDFALDMKTSHSNNMFNQSILDNIERRATYQQNITKDKEETISLKQNQQIANSKTSEPKVITLPATIVSINNLNSILVPHHVNSKNINEKTQLSSNKSVIEYTENVTKNTETVMVLKQATKAETNIVDKSEVIKSSDTLNTETINDPRRVTVVTAPYVQTTSQIFIEQPLLEVTSSKTFTESSETTPTVRSPSVDIVFSKQDTQYKNVRPNVISENPMEDVKTIPTYDPTSEPWSKVRQTGEILVQTTIKQDLNIITPSLQAPLYHSKNNVIDSDQVIESNYLNSNYGPNIFKVDVVNTKVPVLIENELPTRTHSGISVITKTPEETNVDQSLKTIEGKKDKEKEETSEAPDTKKDIPNIVTQAIDTTILPVDNSKQSKSDIGLVNKQNVNVNINLTGALETMDSRLPITTNGIILKTTTEMTTIKKEITDSRNQLTARPAENRLLHVSPEPKEDITTVEPLVIAQNASAVSNIKTAKNNTASSTSLTKSLVANTHNATAERATNSRNFVCKPNSRGRFSDNKDCRKFYICIGKHELIEGFCPNNTVFSELRKQCTNNLSHCVRNNQFQCVSEGRFNDFLNDNNFYICVKNNLNRFIRFTLQCDRGYSLNKTSVHCDLNTESSQSTSQQTDDISKNNSEQHVSSTKSERLVIESSEKFKCKKEGKFPDANDCRKYHICEKKEKSLYRQITKECDSDEIFDKDTKKCIDDDTRSNECS